MFALVSVTYDAVRILIVVIALALLAGCGSASPKPPNPTVVEVLIEASSGLNPDSKGRASPIVMRFFELKTHAAFNGADFFSVWDRERETFGAELVAREEFSLRPSETTTFKRTLQPETRYLGVVAAFRDLEHAQWRADYSVKPHETQSFVIRLDQRSVTVLRK